jgi:photosystem II stability/assembly factor-like uncharacterized protein
VLYKTADGGQTWASVSEEMASIGDIRSLRFTGPLDGWLAVSQLQPSTSPPSAPEFRSRLVHTRDGGRSWTYVDYPALGASVFDITSTHVVITARATGIVLYDAARGFRLGEGSGGRQG